MVDNDIDGSKSRPPLSKNKDLESAEGRSTNVEVGEMDMTAVWKSWDVEVGGDGAEVRRCLIQEERARSAMFLVCVEDVLGRDEGG
jgi:hypothetical protein